jgi:hypothetical protein
MSKYSGNFCPATGITGLNSVSYQLPICFLATFSNLGIPQDKKNNFKGFFQAREFGQQYLKVRVRDYISGPFFGNDTSHVSASQFSPDRLHNPIECNSIPRTLL